MEAATKIISKCYCFPLDENLNFLDFQDVDYFQFFSLVIYIRSYSRYIKGRSEACCPRSSLLVPIKERYSFNINKQRVVLNASQEIQTTENTLNRRRRMVAFEFWVTTQILKLPLTSKWDPEQFADLVNYSFPTVEWETVRVFHLTVFHWELSKTWK